MQCLAISSFHFFPLLFDLIEELAGVGDLNSTTMYCRCTHLLALMGGLFVLC